MTIMLTMIVMMVKFEFVKKVVCLHILLISRTKNVEIIVVYRPLLVSTYIKSYNIKR